jgi:uncharacterized protein YndB with AHSA1/START domain
MAYDYEFLLRIRAPRATVFEKLLRIEHLARWFCGWCRIEPKVGGAFRFGGETCLVLPEGRGWETTIDEGETLKRFAFTWPIQGAATRVAYELEDAGDSTRLRACHTGVPMKDSTCGTLQDAWRMCLGNLKSIAEGRSDSVRPDHAPVASAELRLSNLIEAPPDRIFAAFTDAGQLDHWTTGGVPAGKAKVEPRVGGTFLPGRGGGPGRFVEIESDARIVVEWPQRDFTARIEIRLEPKSSGTAVYLGKTGYREGESETVLRDRGAWSDLLVGLKNFVEGGDAGFANAYDAQVRET